MQPGIYKLMTSEGKIIGNGDSRGERCLGATVNVT